MALLFLKGPLVEISVCTWCPALDGPTFSQESINPNSCVCACVRVCVCVRVRVHVPVSVSVSECVFACASVWWIMALDINFMSGGASFRS